MCRTEDDVCERYAHTHNEWMALIFEILSALNSNNNNNNDNNNNSNTYVCVWVKELFAILLNVVNPKRFTDRDGVCLYIYVCVYVFMCVLYMCTNIYVCIYIFVLYTHANTHIHTHTHTHTHTYTKKLSANGGNTQMTS